MNSVDVTKQTPYELLGGEEIVRELSNAFFNAMDQLPEMQRLRAMHGKELCEIKQKMYEYLTGWLGGANLYFEKYGTNISDKPLRPYSVAGLVYLHKAHQNHHITTIERDQWIRCMDYALDMIQASQEIKKLIMTEIVQLADLIKNQH